MVMASSAGGCSPAMNSSRCCGRPGVGAAAADQEARVLERAAHLHLDVAAARQRGDGAGDEVQQELHLVLAHVAGNRAPDEVVLALADEAARDLLGRAQIDHGAGRSRRAEGEAGELQPRRGLLGDVADDVEGVVLGLLVVVLVENFQAIVDGADGADHVMADFAGDKRGEFKVGGNGALAHRCPL